MRRPFFFALAAACAPDAPPAEPPEEPPPRTSPGTLAAPPVDPLGAGAVGPEPERPRFPSRFLGEDDEAWRRSLRQTPFARVEEGFGGRTLAFKITLVDGRAGYFKPAQSFSAAHWYSEVAAHYLDRELGFGRVPPVVGRRFPWRPLRRVAGDDPRVSEVEVDEDGTVAGAFIGWLEARLPPWDALGRGWEKWVRVQGGMLITPYQRPIDWRGRINGRRSVEETELAGFAECPEEPEPGWAGELSDLIVFDYLISNVDRWGGEYTNVRRHGRGGPLIYLDNGAGFWPGQQRLGLMDARLEALQRFRRETVEALEGFERARFEARLDADPLAPVLSERQRAGVEERRRAVLRHVRAMQRAHGDAIWLE